MNTVIIEIATHTGQLRGVAKDGKTGKTLETVTLPEVERILKALGYESPDAHAHKTYKKHFKAPYEIHIKDTRNITEKLIAADITDKEIFTF